MLWLSGSPRVLDWKKVMGDEVMNRCIDGVWDSIIIEQQQQQPFSLILMTRRV